VIKGETMSFAAVLIGVAAQMATPQESSVKLGRFMSIFGLFLEKSTMAGTAKRLGPAERKDNGLDAAEHAYEMCYRGPDGTTLAIISDGEMGGGTDITAMQLLSRNELGDYGADEELSGGRKRRAVRPTCAALSRLSAATSIAGLRLGASRREVRAQLKAAIVEESSSQLRAASIESAGDSGDETLRSVTIRFEKNKAVSISVSQVTSGP
jgi:hypothetical protein